MQLFVCFCCSASVGESLEIGSGAPKGRFVRSRAAANGAFLARRSQGSSRARGLVKEKTTEEQLVEYLTRQWPMAWRIVSRKGNSQYPNL